jgi:hypothetical protein
MTQCLEGSQTPPRRLDSGRLCRAGRFGAHATIHRICYATSAAGCVPSRRLPRITQRSAVLRAAPATNEGSVGGNIAQGSFREPLAFTFPGRVRDMTNVDRFLGHRPKRLPSRRCVRSGRCSQRSRWLQQSPQDPETLHQLFLARA